MTDITYTALCNSIAAHIATLSRFTLPHGVVYSQGVSAGERTDNPQPLPENWAYNTCAEVQFVSAAGQPLPQAQQGFGGSTTEWSVQYQIWVAERRVDSRRDLFNILQGVQDVDAMLSAEVAPTARFGYGKLIKGLSWNIQQAITIGQAGTSYLVCPIDINLTIY